TTRLGTTKANMTHRYRRNRRVFFPGPPTVRAREPLGAAGRGLSCAFSARDRRSLSLVSRLCPRSGRAGVSFSMLRTILLLLPFCPPANPSLFRDAVLAAPRAAIG